MANYTPIIKAKANDLVALSRLSIEAKHNLKPLIEPPLVKNDKGVATDVSGAVASVMRRLGDQPFYFDPLDYEIPARQTAAFEKLIESECAFTPVVGLGRRNIDLGLMTSLVATQQRGLCVRLQHDDLEDASEDTWIQLAKLASDVMLSPTDIDLLIDFGQLDSHRVPTLRNTVLDFFRMQPRGFNIGAVSVLGSSCLTSVGSIDVDGHGAVARRELELWATLIYELDGTRELGFGDYGILSAQFIFSGPNPNSNAKIRYTRGGNVFYFRGHRLFKPPQFDQYHALAQRVVNSGLFLGSQYSFGDAVIQQCADRRTGPGNLGTWVKADTNHHLEFTARQIPRLLGNLVRVSNEQQIRDVILQDA